MASLDNRIRFLHFTLVTIENIRRASALECKESTVLINNSNCEKIVSLLKFLESNIFLHISSISKKVNSFSSELIKIVGNILHRYVSYVISLFPIDKAI